jgi:hypothetical protein
MPMIRVSRAGSSGAADAVGAAEFAVPVVFAELPEQPDRNIVANIAAKSKIDKHFFMLFPPYRIFNLSLTAAG